LGAPRYMIHAGAEVEASLRSTDREQLRQVYLDGTGSLLRKVRAVLYAYKRFEFLYSDVGAFHRAHKRWTGKTPRRARQSLSPGE
jgi:hypothetical protein